MAARNRRPLPEHVHPMTPHQVQRSDLGFLLGLVGIASLAFVVGKSVNPNADCCERLQNRDVELILCEARMIQAQTQAPQIAQPNWRWQ